MRRGHVIALVGALALLLITAMDWYGTATGDEARRIESITEEPSGAEGGEIDRRLNEDARFVAEREEKNAWQADALIDRILLVVMLAAVLFAVLTAITRASGAKPTKGLGPAGATALIAAGGGDPGRLPDHPGAGARRGDERQGGRAARAARARDDRAGRLVGAAGGRQGGGGGRCRS